MAARYNGIESVVHTYGPRPTLEWALISANRRSEQFALGDSGAVILDQDFRPIAMLWGIVPMVGSDYSPFAYVTPIVEVLRDIERRLGWEVGSATLY